MRRRLHLATRKINTLRCDVHTAFLPAQIRFAACDAPFAGSASGYALKAEFHLCTTLTGNTIGGVSVFSHFRQARIKGTPMCKKVERWFRENYIAKEWLASPQPCTS